MSGLKIRYEMRTWKHGRWIIAEAWPLGVVTQGRTLAKAEANLKDAVTGFLRAAQEHGTLIAVLEDAGYTLRAGTWEFPAVSTTETTLSVA